MNTISKILIMYLFPCLVMNTAVDTKDPWGVKVDSMIEVPVLRVNFYMMGLDSVDTYFVKGISENMDYVNQEFEGQVRFELNDIYIDPNKAYLPDLHQDAFTDEELEINKLVRPIEQKGTLNVFLFDTYYLEGTDKALMGFTPILAGRYDNYTSMTPRFDRIFMAYAGLESQTTLVHEIGHFLGLEHPWEMSHFNKTMMGLATQRSQQHNHMTYNAEVNGFTSEQLERMRDFALKFRAYLVEEIDFIAYN